MRKTLATCATLLLATTTSAQTLDAKVERLNPGGFRISITIPEAVSPAAAQQLLTEPATHLCEGRAPIWGPYTFKRLEPVGGAKPVPASTSFELDLTCAGDTTAAAPKPGTPAPKSPASDAERSDLRARTLDYLAKKDGGHFDAADDLFEQGVLSPTDRDARAAARREFNSEAGQPVDREVVGMTFYDDPADSPRLGRYAAVDYRARYNSRAFYCGYVVWIRQADGNYLLTREDEAIITDAVAAASTPEQLTALKRQPGCRDPG